MVAMLASETQEITRDGVTRWVQGYIDMGMDPNDAFDRVFQEIVENGHAAELAELHGSVLVGDIWRGYNSTLRPRHVRSDRSAVTFRQMPPPIEGAPAPVVPLDTLKKSSMLDCLEKINGRWVRVGDMDAALCEAAAKQYRKSARTYEHNARYFLALGAAIKEGGTVGEKFDDAKLSRLFKITQP